MVASKKTAAKKATKKKAAPKAVYDVNASPHDNGELASVRFIKEHKDSEFEVGTIYNLNTRSAWRWVRRGVAEYV